MPVILEPLPALSRACAPDYLPAVQTLSIFAIAGPGLDRVVADELASLGIPAGPHHGGAAWEGSIEDVARANLHLRTASRIIVRAGEFRARTFHELERRARRIDWDRFVASRDEVRLRVTCRKSALYHEGAVAERILDAIEERTGRRGATHATDEEEGDDATGQLFVVRIVRDVCTISADSSGGLLHRRGYREAVAKAPLRETIAAAMLRACGWTPDQPLLDPLCGSGTIAIEAALIARNIAPGLARRRRTPRAFRFLDWPSLHGLAWDDIIAQATTRIRPHCPAPILASDRNAGAIRAATANADRAGVEADVEFAVRPLSSVVPPRRAASTSGRASASVDGGNDRRSAGTAGWIVTNPPYGERIGNRADARRITHELHARLQSDFDGWSLAALIPGHEAADSPFATRNGGIPVHLEVHRI
jgi:putative N6-adenine-specific DNA methylase